MNHRQTLRLETQNETQVPGQAKRFKLQTAHYQFGKESGESKTTFFYN